MSDDKEKWLQQVKWNPAGLVPAIAQDKDSGRVLTLAWMNAEALSQTVTKKQAVYWSRSRQTLWHKGERSGLFQHVYEIRLDCDGDTLLMRVKQDRHVACHTGRESCFYLRLEDGQWRESDPVLIEPAQLYGKQQ